MGATPEHALPWPDNTARVADGWDAIRDLAEKVEDVLDGSAVAPAWTAYTPAFTGVTLGNGVANGAYRKIGRLVHFRARFAAGSSTTYSAGTLIGVSLPVAQSTAVDQYVAGVIRNGVTNYYQVAGLINFNVASQAARWYYNGAQLTTSAGPHAWNTSTDWTIAGTYEAAA